MAKETAATTDVQALGRAIADAIQANAPARKITFDEFKPVSPFNPTGKQRRKLAFPVYINYVRVNPDTTFDEEISLLAQIKPGKFVNGLVTIVEGDKGGNKEMHIRWKSASHEDRIALKNECRNLIEILRRCVDEANSGGVLSTN